MIPTPGEVLLRLWGLLPPWLQGWYPWRWWGVGLVLGGVVLMSAVLRARRPAPDGYGSAAWATRREVQRAGCYSTEGIIVGRLGRHLLRLDGEDDVLVLGPKGSGKSVGVIIPTLLTYRHSVIALDLKGTLVRVTGRARRRLGRVYVFDPVAGGDTINPYDLVRWTTHAVLDVQRIVSHLTYTEASMRSDASLYYLREAQAALTATSLYLHERHPDACHPAGLLHFYTAGGSSVPQLLKQMQQSAPPAVADWAAMMLQETPTDQRKIWAAARGWLMPWQDPRLAHATAATTIDLEDFQHRAHPATLYLRLSAEDVQGRLRAFTRLLLDVLVSRLTDRPPAAYRQALLLCLDDFAELQYFPLIERATAFLREHGVRLLAAAQSFGQVWQAFGQDTALFDNMAWVVFRPGSPRSAQFLADKLGLMTVAEDHRRTTRQALSWQASATHGVARHGRPLLDTAEVMRLDPQTVLICARGLTIRAQALRYYEDRRCKALVV